jgi:hypothetical protein
MALRVAIFATGRWGPLLANLINQTPSLAVQAWNVSPTVGGLSKNALAIQSADLLLRVGLRPGAGTVRGEAFDCLWTGIRALARRAKCAYYWIGTDLHNTVSGLTSGVRNTRFLSLAKRDRHLAAAPWFVPRLAELGIHAVPVLFPSGIPQDPIPSTLPSEFRLLSYIPDFRPEFYSGEEILQLAKDIPSISVDVVGGSGNWARTKPDNVVFHGWTNRMDDLYKACATVVRVVRHDAFGNTVREGLAHARPVVYSNVVPHVHYVPYGDYEALRSRVMSLREEHSRGDLRPNAEGAAYARRELDPALLVGRLVKALFEAATGA